jgi:rubrerythrin
MCSAWVEGEQRPSTCPQCGAPWGGYPVPQARARRDLPPSWYARGMGDRRLGGDHDEGTHAWDLPPQPVQVNMLRCPRCGHSAAADWVETWGLCPICAEVEAERAMLSSPAESQEPRR